MSGGVANLGKAVRAEDTFDVAAVDAVLKAEIDGLEGVPLVRQFPAGASNLTYLLRYKDKDLVLRRPPGGARPKSGHSMIREYTVMKALKPVFPAVPTVYHYSAPERSVLGEEFYVMEKVPGVVPDGDWPAGWTMSPADARDLCTTVWDLLADLHAVDVAAAGLSDFGQPDGYVHRQIHGWNTRYEKALTADADPFEDVRDWLASNMPSTESGHAVVHGDYRIDNIVFGDAPPHPVQAVLDWEISALGDPLMDLGASLAYWIEPDDPPALQVLKKQPSDTPGMMTRAEVVAHYTAKTGLKVDDFTFYYAYGIFRLAVIAQQIYYRYDQKQTTNPKFAMFGPGAKGLGEVVRKLMTGDMTFG